MIKEKGHREDKHNHSNTICSKTKMRLRLVLAADMSMEKTVSALIVRAVANK